MASGSQRQKPSHLVYERISQWLSRGATKGRSLSRFQEVQPKGDLSVAFERCNQRGFREVQRRGDLSGAFEVHRAKTVQRRYHEKVLGKFNAHDDLHAYANQLLQESTCGPGLCGRCRASTPRALLANSGTVGRSPLSPSTEGFPKHQNNYIHSFYHGTC
jgi:hypothetical protein